MATTVRVKCEPPQILDEKVVDINHVSHGDIDLAIERERIVCILTTSINQIELALCLPILLENNGCLLKRHLKKDEMTLVIEACSPYLIEKEEEYEDTISDNDETLKDEESVKKETTWPSEALSDKREDPQICKAIKVLWSKTPIRRITKGIIQEISLPASSFLEHLNNLRDIAMKRISTSPFHEHARELYLRHLWHHNECVKMEISQLKTEIEEMDKDIEMKLTVKTLLINQYEAKIERINKKCKDDIRKRVYDSERKMITDWKDSELLKETLTTDFKTLEAKMKALLNTHLADEKDLRAKRLKVEAQLTSWLNKYDTDIGEKQAIYDEILEGYEEEKRQMDELQEQFDDQQDEYETLMAEKAEEEQNILEKKMYIFILNRSARKIQRCWRAYRERKLARRKARKKGKGKKGKK